MRAFTRLTRFGGMGLKSVPNPTENNPLPAESADPQSAKQSGNGNSPHELLITELVKARAELMPNGLALESSAQSLTYRELEVRANQLARHLRTLGVGP